MNLLLSLLLYQASPPSGNTQTFSLLTICFYIGIVLLLACLVFLATGLGEKLPKDKQIIRVPGVNLEVSLMTLLFLISLALISTGIWWQLQNINETVKRLDALQKDNDRLRDEVKNRDEQLRSINNKMDIDANLVLEGVNPKSTEELNNRYICTYRLSSNPASETADMIKDNQTIKITFKNLTRGVNVEWVQINTKDGSTAWTSTGLITPLVQKIEMKKQ